ncbi:hypothetical protein [Umezawaea tangerina]|uniref:Cysteine dioxygenase type I n=1 Tax=Umezawaea tangerina TaxID=84725 RepID=A0A2T0S8G5_9PSEU|nr:hypothetical protein [Umezawaea tangerina]PRY29705.1 hypothetical protein CLV43_12554 [Umezawaea tangerina]
MPTDLTGLATITELASRITSAGPPAADRWSDIGPLFGAWAAQPGLRERLREHLRALPPQERTRVVARSRETTTHFAWCLRDEPSEPFTFWLHEYKPQRDWRHGYADSVHNHRYHFCTTILSGSYLHERYEARLDGDGTAILSTGLLRRTECPAGASGTMLAHEFHRIPRAEDDTMTFLVKSRAVRPWSLSFDPDTRSSHRHVPVESRWEELTKQL